MLASSLVLLSPSAGLVALAVAIPLGVLALVARLERAGREALGLPAPPPTRRLPRILALVAIPLLLALAAMQPALRSTTSERVRTDAEAFFVIDISRSMIASASPDAPTRLERAKQEAITLRNALNQVPSGVATLTDRVLPNLFPNADPNVFFSTVKQTVDLEAPGPTTSNIAATEFCKAAQVCALGALGTQNFFSPTARQRLMVVLTDGETNHLSTGTLAAALASGPGVHAVFVHVWAKGEAVYAADGSRESGYHEDLTSGQTLKSIAAAVGGKSFSESSLGGAIRAMHADLGTTGPTKVRGKTVRTQTLSPYVVLLALLPLLALLLPSWRRAPRLRLLRASRSERDQLAHAA